MSNLLADPIIRTRLSEGDRSLTLPQVYEAAASDRIIGFTALRPHQRHAWHAFLVQLAVIATGRAGLGAPPESAGEWSEILQALTPSFEDDEPWRLVVDDPAQPAFLQCPAPGGLGQYKRQFSTPDDLDLLVSSKNHAVKQRIASSSEHDDWLFALVCMQTMSGYMGLGNYGIARMNGGSSSRPCLGLAPATGGFGAHLLHDAVQVLARRPALQAEYPAYYRKAPGRALLWLVPWDGSSSLDLRDLDPHFIEVSRRIRLKFDGRGLVAMGAPSKVARIAAKEARGNLGDHWTPVHRADGKALTLSSVGFRYDRLAKLLFGNEFVQPAAMRAPAPGRWRVVARGLAGGQGKTEGYHERSDIVFSAKTGSMLMQQRHADDLAKVSKEQLEEVKQVADALKVGVAVAASGGKRIADLVKADRLHVLKYVRRLDETADATFFDALDRRFTAKDKEAERAERARFARELISSAEQQLNAALEEVPCPTAWRHRARARASRAFHGVLRGPKSRFSDQPEIFERGSKSMDVTEASE